MLLSGSCHFDAKNPPGQADVAPASRHLRRLYITGHDHSELYVLQLPKGGSILEHVATITAPIEGQAIAFDRGRPGVLYGISRPAREVVVMWLPELPNR